MFDEQTNTESKKKILRCAIYTRKSTEEGLDQNFNSLDAQRDACESYIESQKSLGWRLIPDHFDDGGFSGGNTNRPGLTKLMAEVEAGMVDVIVVYKIDRLSRSLLDFSKMIERFEKLQVSFVSVTQQITTTNAHGRVMLNVLMSFAQYEREVASERIRDKLAAAKRRGKYCGGIPILGYDVDREQKKLVVNDNEAIMVKFIFRRFLQLGSVTILAKELNDKGYRTKAWVTKTGKKQGDEPWNKSHIYRFLSNRTYIGEVTHKGQVFPGEHQAIIEREIWTEAQELIQEKNRNCSTTPRVNMVSPLKGVMRCGHCDSSMGTTYTKKTDRRYSYYICEKDAKRPVSTCPIKRVPAGDIEKAIIEQLGAVFRTPTLIAQTYEKAREFELQEHQSVSIKRAELEKRVVDVQAEMKKIMTAELTVLEKAEKLRQNNEQIVELTRAIQEIAKREDALTIHGITEREISESFETMDIFWNDLFPLEQKRLIDQLVEVIEIRETGIDMVLNTAGMSSLILELAGLACEVKTRKDNA